MGQLSESRVAPLLYIPIHAYNIEYSYIPIIIYVINTFIIPDVYTLSGPRGQCEGWWRGGEVCIYYRRGEEKTKKRINKKLTSRRPRLLIAPSRWLFRVGRAGVTVN